MAAKHFQLKAEKRTVIGRKVKKLRKKGLLIANLYGRDIKSQPLQLSLNEFNKIFKQAGETGIIELSITGETKPRPTLIHNLQKDPISAKVIHVDFRQVDLAKKITATVPIELIGEAPGESKGGVLVQQIKEIEVEALPTDLPDKLTVEISSLEEIDQFITLEQLKYDKNKVSLKIEDPKAIVVKIEPPAKEEVEEKPAAPEAVEGAEAQPVKEEEEKKKEETKKPEEAKQAPTKEKKPEEGKK
jgi:large subunit ribosomal protein L25